MRRKVNRVKIKRKDFIIIILVMLIVLTILVFKIIDKRVKPVMLSYANSETKRIATIVINNAINKQVSDNLSVDDLFDITYDNNKAITSIDFNPIIVNKFLTTTTNNVGINLKYVEEGNIEFLELEDIKVSNKKMLDGIIYEVPIGYLFNNGLLTNILPKVPVKMSLIGNIVSKVNTKITNYGINNAMIELNIDLTVNIRVILPLMSDTIKVKTSVPIAMKLIQGNIPNYYLNGITEPSVTLPIN